MAVVVLGLSVSYAEDRVVGHWGGQIEIPGQPIPVKIDLAINDGIRGGTIDIPAQGAAFWLIFGLLMWYTLVYATTQS